MSVVYVYKKQRMWGAGAMAWGAGGQNYEVSCLQCCAYIGTMSGAQVSKAIMLTAGRGGVLCPDCREKTCDFCGLTLENSSQVVVTYFADKQIRHCKICELLALETNAKVNKNV